MRGSGGGSGGGDGHGRVHILRHRRQTDFGAASLIAELQGNVLRSERSIGESGDFHTKNDSALINVERRFREGEGVQLASRIGHVADLESLWSLRAEISGNQVVRGFLASVDVEAIANLEDHRNLEGAAASDGIKRGESTGGHQFAAGRNLRGRRGCDRDGRAHQNATQKRETEFQTVTCSPSCCEITRLITECRSSPVFSRTKELRAPDQLSLKLVESAEIQISRTGVLGETTNLASSGSSNRTSSFPLSPSTSKPCSSPKASRRRFNSSKAASAFRRKSCSSSIFRGYQSCDSTILENSSALMGPVTRLICLPLRSIKTLVG